MSRVHPLPSSSSSTSTSTRRETFTIWMKSLVMQANGCTVYNQNGDIVYRIDNYENKRSREVYLMNLHGKVVLTIRKVAVLNRWEGFQGDCYKSNSKKSCFQVKKNGDVTLSGVGGYRLESMDGLNMKIVDNSNRGRVVAEAKRKELGSGVVLGDDVLSLVVESNVDQSLVMGLVTVHALMHNRI